MDKNVNDATSSIKGNIYQFIVALNDCFELNEGDNLLIEVHGDVSIAGLMQKEIKHHDSKDNLTERDIDFWKTLANWYVSYDSIKNYNSLILFTTSEIPIDSRLQKWNDKSANEKLSILTAIGSEHKKREETFRKEFLRIFNDAYNEKRLLDILNKFKIEQENDNINTISKSIYTRILYIPDKNRDNFIAALLGLIILKITKPPYKWEISYSDFKKFLQEETPKYANESSIPLSTEFAYQEPRDEQKKELLDKVFVSEIRAIDYDEVIPEAVSDYWKTSKTIAKYFLEDPIYCRDLDLYKNDLKSKMDATKRNSIIDADGKSEREKVKLSKKLYNDIIAWDAKDFGSIIKNQSYFQHGIIHNIVDDRQFIWKLPAEGTDK